MALREEGFGAALRRHRQARGLSQQELAERAGLSVRGISALERGERLSPQPATVRQLADALGLEEADRAALIANARVQPETPLAVQGTLPGFAAGSGHPRWRRLPLPPAAIIGRTGDLTSLRDLLQPRGCSGVRLVTLTGPGGIGKTRLALAAGSGLGPCFGGRAAWVDLAAIRDVSVVAGAIAGAIGARVDPGVDLIETLATQLGDQPALLIIDNFEHVLEAAPFVATLLAHCANLRVLATSRERLNLRGEHVYPVAPLAGPSAADPAGPLTEADVAASFAVQLFVDRAAAIQPGFHLTSGNASDVAQICVRLEGMPLALELAAAQIQTFSPAAILDRLTHRLTSLTEGPRDLSARQRSMRKTIAWSHNLLTDEQLTLFRRLSVFAGGFTIAEAEAICATLPGLQPLANAEANRPTPNLAQVISALVQKSLIEPEPEEPPLEGRFRLLEVIREFAAEKLVERGEAPAMFEAHADYFLRHAEGFRQVAVAAMDSVAALGLVESSFPNIRAALVWFEQERNADALLNLTGSLNWFWPLRQHIHEGIRWLEAALAMPGPASPQNRVRAMMALGLLTYLLGNDERTERIYGDALAIATSAEDQFGAALAVTSLGALAVHRSDYARGAALSEQALVLCSRIADPHTATWLTASALTNLGSATHRLGSTAAARDHLAHAIACFRELTYKMGLMRTLQYAAGVARDAGDVRAAIRDFAESLDLAAELGDEHRLAAAFDGLATTAALTGDPDRAAGFFGASERIRDQLGGGQPAPPLDRESYREGVALTNRLLGDTGFHVAWDDGRSLSRADAVAEARAFSATADVFPDAASQREPGSIR